MPQPTNLLPEHTLYDSSYLVRMLNLKPHAIYRLCKARKIEHFRIGKLLYFSQQAIDDYLNRCRVKAKSLLALPILDFGELLAGVVC